MEAVQLELDYGAQHYTPIPVAARRASGMKVFDIEAAEYQDFCSANGALNFGHAHPVLLETLRRQAGFLTTTAQTMYTDRLGPFLEILCKTFGYERAAMLTTEHEATGVAIRTLKEWGRKTKKSKEPVVLALGGAMGHRSDIAKGPYNDTDALKELLKANPHVVAVVVEPVAFSGIIIPEQGYLQEVKSICAEAGILMVVDETKTSLGRINGMSASSEVNPDMVILGSSLAGGMFPCSALLSCESILTHMGDFDSQFAGSPIATALADDVLGLIDENVLKNVASAGEVYENAMTSFKNGNVTNVRSIGMLMAFEYIQDGSRMDAKELQGHFKDNGLLLGRQGNTFVMTPPLTTDGDVIWGMVDALQWSMTTMDCPEGDPLLKLQ